MEDFKKLPKMQSFKTGGSVKNAYCGGGRMKKGGEVESAAEIKQDKASDPPKPPDCPRW
mgnify:CR=1 FL=1